MIPSTCAGCRPFDLVLARQHGYQKRLSVWPVCRGDPDARLGHGIKRKISPANVLNNCGVVRVSVAYDKSPWVPFALFVMQNPAEGFDFGLRCWELAQTAHHVPHGANGMLLGLWVWFETPELQALQAGILLGKVLIAADDVQPPETTRVFCKELDAIR